MKDFEATITNPERAAEWLEHLGTTTVCVRSPISLKANLPDKPGALIYELDIDALTDDQRNNLVTWLASKFGIPMNKAWEDVKRVGIPILADDVIITIHNPLRWL